MKLAQVQFTLWDKVYNFSYNNINSLSVGEKVIAKVEAGTSIGTIVGFININENEISNLAIKPEDDKSDDIKTEKKENNSEQKTIFHSIIRKATESDLKSLPSEKEKKDALSYCRKMKEKYDLPMKFIDINYAIDGSRVTLAFISDGRVDFRELVKDLTRYFSRTVRLQQIGIRDEARIKGDYGPCGRPLCCKTHLKNLVSITSDMAEVQQISHRGSERISGICGRLMCCLAYEEEGYKGLLKKMPPLGTKVNVDGERGIVVGHHILKQSVDVKFSGNKEGENRVAEIDLNRHNN